MPARATLTVDLGRARDHTRTVLGAPGHQGGDHLIVEVDPLDRPSRPGDGISFIPTYAATLQLSTSPYVHKVFTPPA
jgi:hypothetical protein